MKAHFKLSEDAKDDLRRIYKHGFRAFGEALADEYYGELIERFDLISQEPMLYPVAHEIDPNLRKSVCGVDVIYYEITQYGVFIVRVLGRQDRNTILR